MIFTEASAASLRRISGTIAATVDRKFFLSFFYLCNFMGTVKTIVFGVLCSSLKEISGAVE